MPTITNNGTNSQQAILVFDLEQVMNTSTDYHFSPEHRWRFGYYEAESAMPGNQKNFFAAFRKARLEPGYYSGLRANELVFDRIAFESDGTLKEIIIRRENLNQLDSHLLPPGAKITIL